MIGVSRFRLHVWTNDHQPCCCRTRLSQGAPDSGKQGRRVVRLFEKTSRAELKGLAPQFWKLTGGQKDDGRGCRKVSLDCFSDAKTGTRRQGHIQENQVRPLS